MQALLPSSAAHYLEWSRHETFICEIRCTPSQCSASTGERRTLIEIKCSPAFYKICSAASFSSLHSSTKIHEILDTLTDCYILFLSLLWRIRDSLQAQQPQCRYHRAAACSSRPLTEIDLSNLKSRPVISYNGPGSVPSRSILVIRPDSTFVFRFILIYYLSPCSTTTAIS